MDTLTLRTEDKDMTLASRGSLLSPLFLIELHSTQPERMIEFYERTLSITFKSTTYPYPCFVARLGRISFLISDTAEHDPSIESASGSVTLGLLTNGPPGVSGDKYFLYPQRPLGRSYPSQYATRIKDPDGNYLALAASMEHVMGRIPPVNSLSELLDCIREYALVVLEGVRRKVRHAIDHAIDRSEFISNRVTFLKKDLGTCTHVVASREGLYVVSPNTYKRLMRGAFYGLSIKNGAIYCFQSCGQRRQNGGRILKLELDAHRIRNVEVVAKGFDDGCHQIDFIGNDLFIVDCYNGRILEITPGKPGSKTYYPLGRLSREVARDEYHMNSLAGHPDGTVWILLHNKNKKPSEVLVVNRDFELLRRFSVNAGAAHNIVFTGKDHEFLIADSCGARIMSSHGAVGEIEMMRPRGISLDDRTCVVGDSFFCARPFRRYVPGRVHFFNRQSWICESSLLLPAAPTEIRRIDGLDFSLSNYVFARSKGLTTQSNSAAISSAC